MSDQSEDFAKFWFGVNLNPSCQFLWDPSQQAREGKLLFIKDYAQNAVILNKKLIIVHQLHKYM